MDIHQLIAALTLIASTNADATVELPNGELINSVWAAKNGSRVILDNAGNDPKEPNPLWVKIA